MGGAFWPPKCSLTTRVREPNRNSNKALHASRYTRQRECRRCAKGEDVVRFLISTVLAFLTMLIVCMIALVAPYLQDGVGMIDAFARYLQDGGGVIDAFLCVLVSLCQLASVIGMPILIHAVLLASLGCWLSRFRLFVASAVLTTGFIAIFVVPTLGPGAFSDTHYIPVRLGITYLAGFAGSWVISLTQTKRSAAQQEDRPLSSEAAPDASSDEVSS